jgi:glycosyltransferase involved in cell wall biosynthesis
VKILFLTDGIYPFQLGGMQKHSLILSRLLAKKGVEIKLFHIGGEGYSADAFISNYGDERNIITEVCIPFPKTDPLPGHYIRENKLYSKLIFDAVKNELDDFDLVYAQGFTGWHFIKEKKKGKHSLPVLVNFHGLEMFQTAPSTKVKLEHMLFRKAVKYNLMNGDYAYSFGGKITDVLLRLGLAEDKVLLQSNGIEEDWISFNSQRNQKRTLTFIGRNERRKGVEELNLALRNIIERKDLIFRFNFIGPIPKENQIEDGRIVYHGEIRNVEEIKEILHHSDAIVCPSHSEGMPTVILEGMASGLAVIATNVGAVERMVKGNGYLLSGPNPRELEQAIRDFIACSAEDLNRMKNTSIDLVRDQFVWDTIADQKIKDFEKAISETT